MNFRIAIPTIARAETIKKKTINYLELRGYESIKADIDGYESPKSFLMRSTGIEITPDIVVETNGKVQYIEVGYKAEDADFLKTNGNLSKHSPNLKIGILKCFLTKDAIDIRIS